MRAGALSGRRRTRGDSAGSRSRARGAQATSPSGSASGPGHLYPLLRRAGGSSPRVPGEGLLARRRWPSRGSPSCLTPILLLPDPSASSRVPLEVQYRTLFERRTDSRTSGAPPRGRGKGGSSSIARAAARAFLSMSKRRKALGGGAGGSRGLRGVDGPEPVIVLHQRAALEGRHAWAHPLDAEHRAAWCVRLLLPRLSAGFRATSPGR